MLLLDAVQPQSGALAALVNCPDPALPPVNVRSTGKTWNVHPEPPVPAWSISGRIARAGFLRR
jgi:hypothetical protein